MKKVVFCVSAIILAVLVILLPACDANTNKPEATTINENMVLLVNDGGFRYYADSRTKVMFVEDVSGGTLTEMHNPETGLPLLAEDWLTMEKDITISYGD